MPPIDDWKRRLGKPASKMILGGVQQPENRSSSWFGRILQASPGEAWPRHAGQLMWPLCQINCEELPYRPDVIADLSMITVFIAPNVLPNDTANGDGWCLRAYPAKAEVQPIEEPAHGSPLRPHSVHWELIEHDYPTYDDLPPDFPDELRDQYFDLDFENTGGTKLGGWPTNIQAEIYWAPFNRHPANPRYVFQIDSEPKANWFWGDQGVGYFGRGTGASRDVWTMSWQCL
ncbi:MAG TPA: DUF1963 domain-containing protein [Tepidisphaeraceae bacterium]|jgi:hypothetical protein|nr:DUF1963 domain-containing protein [Tepidisphaeraceae bacterium]